MPKKIKTLNMPLTDEMSKIIQDICEDRGFTQATELTRVLYKEEYRRLGLDFKQEEDCTVEKPKGTE